MRLDGDQIREQLVRVRPVARGHRARHLVNTRPRSRRSGPVIAPSSRQAVTGRAGTSAPNPRRTSAPVACAYPRSAGTRAGPQGADHRRDPSAVTHLMPTPALPSPGRSAGRPLVVMMDISTSSYQRPSWQHRLAMAALLHEPALSRRRGSRGVNGATLSWMRCSRSRGTRSRR